ncbi:hypothetical protein HYV12_01755 [Candidatus Dojkabacteria bacterium]|nr:hypothetical protein [Candidatus Dojkabacteria bacterium]
MKFNAHCYLHSKIRLDGPSLQFDFEGYKVTVRNGAIGSDGHEDGLSLMLAKENANPIRINGDEDREELTRKELEKVRDLFFSVATLLEGWFSIHYLNKFPPFDISHVIVTFFAENTEEEELFNSGLALQGMGDVHVSNAPGIEFVVNLQARRSIENNIPYIPLFSFFTKAWRATNSGDPEIAYLLLFKVIEGVYGDGSGKSKALEENASKISTYLPISQKLLQAVSDVLIILSLPVKSTSGEYTDVIKDLALIRHKIAHYSEEESVRYFNRAVRAPMKIINTFLLSCVHKIIAIELGAIEESSAEESEGSI